MKKTLSILLSLLMVLSTVTCLFTMPVSAEEAATESETTVETLPVNDYITNNGTKTITPDTVWKYNDSCSFPMATNFNIRGWNAQYQKDEEGNFVLDESGNKILISGQDNSYIDPGVLYQFTFDVTVSEDATDSAKFFIDLYSQNFPQAFAKLVGVRTDSTTPNKVETAYNYTADAKQGAAGTVNSTASKAATLVKGKTYTYTYLFLSASTYISAIGVFVDGLTEGSVTISNAKIFPVSETDAGNFLMKKEVIPYAVEEDGNVFTRLYGYRDVNSTAKTKYTVSTQVGGSLYGIELKGGNNYTLDFDMRVTSDTSLETLGYSPAFDFYDPFNQNYTELFNSIKEAAGTTETDDGKFISQYKLDTNEYVTAGPLSSITGGPDYSGPNNGYSYFYAAGPNGDTTTQHTVTKWYSATYCRRIVKNIASVDFYDANGVKIVTAAENYGSAQGRTVKDAINNKGWMDVKYNLNAVGAQTAEEAYIAAAQSGTGSEKGLRYKYIDGKWTFEPTNGSRVVSETENETVAFGMEYLYAGVVYDFDNFALLEKSEGVVEYKNKAGEVIELPENEVPATVTKNISTGELSIEDHDNTDAFTFEGWHVNGEFVGTDANITVAKTDTVKAVIVYENILTNAGGFENYTTNGQSLRVPYGTATGDVTGKSYTYSTEGPTGDKWGYWTSFNKADATDVELIANNKHIATDGIWGGDNWFDVKVHKGVTTAYYYPEGSNSGTRTKFTVAPHRGDWMLSTGVHSRHAARKIEGLEVGKTYTLSFYFYSPSTYNYLKNVAITTDYLHLNSVAYTLGSTYGDNINIGATGISKDDFTPQEWNKVEVTFKATDTYAYLITVLQNGATNNCETFIDDMVLVEYDCKGNHIYDDFSDTQCNICGATREYLNEWSFEDGVMENITVIGKSEIKVVDAVDQADKIGDKYLQYTSAGFDGMVINFEYDNAYKYVISYDFKIFKMGDGTTANGIDHYLYKFDDGKYGATGKYGLAPLDELDEGFKTETYQKMTATALNKAGDNIITRYYEDGTPWEKVSGFTHPRRGEGAFYGTTKVDGVWAHIADSYGGAALWNEWQHIEIEVGNNNDYKGLVEFGIRPNDSGWIVGLDNFKVEKVAMTTINEAADATNGTYAFNIRARSAEKKQGLRFKSTIDLDKLNLADGAKIVEYGTLAMKKSDADQGYFLRREVATDMTAKGKVVAGVAYSSDKGVDVRYALDEATNTLTYTGVLTGIGIKNYDVDFVVRGYAIVETADGNRITVYDDQATLSVYDAAVQIVETNTNEADVAVAQTVIDTYNAYTAQ